MVSVRLLSFLKPKKKNKQDIDIKMARFAQNPQIHIIDNNEPLSQNDDTASKASSRPNRSRAGSLDSRYNEENLGDNFEDTPWFPPSIEKAQEYKEQSIIRGGRAPLRTVHVCRATDLGPGVSLYFQFVKSMAICMFFMSILSCPSMIFAYFGQRIETQNQDTTGFYRFTYGNIGNDPIQITQETCRDQTQVPTNSTCIQLFDSVDVTLVDVASILTLCEILQFFVFVSTIAFLNHRSKTLQAYMKKENITVCDYSVIVRNLPPDCTAEQVLSHFSNLYGLDRPDWLNRPPVEGAHPVRRCDNTNREMHVGTWVSDCTLFKKIGRYIATFKDHEHITTTLFRCRAKMKMFASDTPHALGPSPRKYAQAEAEMVRTALKVDSLTEKIMKTRDQAVRNPRTFELAGNIESDTKKDYNTHIHEDVAAAFITFEYTESMARCIEDYSKFSIFPRSLFYPPELKFRGRRVRLKQAPEPDDIVFENLEVNVFTKRLLRLRTTFAMLVSLVICFGIILQAGRYKQEFSNSIPNIGYCANVIPQQYAVLRNYSYYGNFVLTRPNNTQLSHLDNLCSSTVPETFYAIYTIDGNFLDPAVSYDVSACTTASPEGLCPALGETTYCPCVSVSSSQSCRTFQCITEGPTSTNCASFDASLLGDCFCFADLTSLINRGLGISFLTDYSTISSTPLCSSFYEEYTAGEALTYLATVLVVAINMILQRALKVLNRAERHGSVSNEQGAYTLKLFLAQYLNTAIVPLIVFGSVSNLPQVFVQSFILQGAYDDFNSAWYGNVGAYLMLTIAVQIVSVPAWPLFSYVVWYPLQRCVNYPSIRKLTNSRIVMQDELNGYEVGPVFDTSSHTANALVLVFFTMTFATGLPLLVPIASVSLIIYFAINKLLICRFYHRPPRIGEGVMRVVLTFLPYAVVIRLAIACWMFGNSNFFPSSLSEVTINFGYVKISTTAYANWLSQQHWFNDWIGERLMKPNVFPLFLLLAITMGYKLLRFFFRYILPIEFLVKYIHFYVKTWFNKTKTNKIRPEAMSRRSTISGFDLIQLHDELRQEAAPFSEKYYSYVLDKDDIPNTCSKMICNTDPLFLSEQEILDGWVLVDHDKYVLKCKVWVSDTHDHDVSNPVGDFKRTFEVIADEGCHSYNLEMIPAYRKAIIGLEQGANNMEKDAAFSMIENLKIRRGSTTKETKNPSTGRSSKGEGKVSEDSSSSSSSSSGSDSSESSGSSGKSHIDNDDDRNISAVRKTKPETQHPVHNTGQVAITLPPVKVPKSLGSPAVRFSID